jgi:hypothetical protein
VTAAGFKAGDQVVLDGTLKMVFVKYADADKLRSVIEDPGGYAGSTVVRTENIAHL